MDSLDAQCLLLGVAADPGCAPPHWAHPRDGSLSFHFPDSAKVHSWPSQEVAEMAARWRRTDNPPPSPAVARMVHAHVAFVALLENGDLEQPDLITHDLDAEELQAIWEDRRLRVVVDLDDPAGALGLVS